VHASYGGVYVWFGFDPGILVFASARICTVQYTPREGMYPTCFVHLSMHEVEAYYLFSFDFLQVMRETFHDECGYMAPSTWHAVKAKQQIHAQMLRPRASAVTKQSIHPPCD
jgi:hypothetical protein